MELALVFMDGISQLGKDCKRLFVEQLWIQINESNIQYSIPLYINWK